MMRGVRCDHTARTRHALASRGQPTGLLRGLQVRIDDDERNDIYA